ncbi:choice-of-anchor C family protein [Streptomyces sp. NPDC002888]|uniref:choice-of-anchor C family protein n=1 Tax=Streptomyces sp. NPDC002888 TaxID=3364668 RepID=UPI0036A77DBD
MSTPTPDHFENGGFESPKLMQPVKTVPTGDSIGPWKVVTGDVDLVSSGYWSVAEGSQSLDLNGYGPGEVSQTFATTPGTTYTVTYSLAGNPDQQPTVKTGKVLVDGQDVQDFSCDTTGRSHQDMGWVTRQVTFVATSSSTTLSFRSTTANSLSGPVIDNVTVSSAERACISSDSGNALTRGTDGCLYVPQPPAQPTLDPASCNAAEVTENGLRVPRTTVDGIAPGTSVGTERSVDIDVTETPGCPEIWTVGARLTPVSGIAVSRSSSYFTPGAENTFSIMDVSELTVTLPEAGIYDLDVNLRYELNNNDGPASTHMSARLTNTTTGVDVPDSETLVCHLNNTNPQYAHSTVPINVRYEVSEPSTITVRGYLTWQTYPLKTAMLGGGDGNGYSRFRWTKISD